MVNLIPVFALLLAVIVGVWVGITIAKRIESTLECIDSKLNTIHNASLTTEAAAKWFLRERNMEVDVHFGHYNVQSICVNCYGKRAEQCIGCSGRRDPRFGFEREDVRLVLSQLEDSTKRVVKAMQDTSRDSVDALALALNFKSGI